MVTFLRGVVGVELIGECELWRIVDGYVGVVVGVVVIVVVVRHGRNPRAMNRINGNALVMFWAMVE